MKVHILTLTDDDEQVMCGAYSTAQKANDALIDFVADSPIGGEDGPMSFDRATALLTECTNYRWQIFELEVDGPVLGI